MGASVSTTVSKQVLDASNKTVQSCSQSSQGGSVSNVVDITGTNFTPGPDCPTSSLTINQQANLQAKCVLSAAEQNTAELLTKLDNKATAGLGFAVSTTVSKNTENINNYLKQTCTSDAVNNTTNIKGSSFGTCVDNIIQNASKSDMCQINALQGIASKIQSNVDQSSKGGSIIGDLFGSGTNFAIFMIVLLIVCVIGGVGYYYYQKKEKNEVIVGGSNFFDDDMDVSDSLNDSWSYSLKKNPVLWILVILVIIIVVFFLIGWANSRSKNKDRQITENDVDKYNSMISDAKKIMEQNSRAGRNIGYYNNCPATQAVQNQPYISPNISQQNSPYASPRASPYASPQMPSYVNQQRRNMYTMDSIADQNSLNDFYKLPLEHDDTRYSNDFF